VARVIASTRLLGLIFALAFMSGCGGSAQPTPPAPTPLSAENLNLIFVVSEDLAYHASGDMNPETANLTNRGLQRTLAMGSFLQQKVLGGLNVNGIFALEPMTHLQTAQHYPDVVPLETIQQFAMLNQIMLSYESFVPVANNSFPLNVSYSSAPVPGGVVQPLQMCSSANRLPYSCQGLDFRDADDANETLLSDLINANSSGFYVFSAPWETVKTMMHGVSAIKGYQLSLATAYSGPNYIYAISVTPSGLASFVTYDTQITPSAAYPTLPAGGIVSVPCLPATTNTTFHIQVTGGVGDAVVPAGVNKNETLYMIRHAEAHPTPVVRRRQLRRQRTMAHARSAIRLGGQDSSQRGVLDRSGTGDVGQHQRRWRQLFVRPDGHDSSPLRHREQPAIQPGSQFLLAGAESSTTSHAGQRLLLYRRHIFESDVAGGVGARPYSDNGQRAAVDVSRRPNGA
jgi:hypothetical protein